MEENNNNGGDGGFVATLALVGGAMAGMGICNEDLSMGVIGGVFLAPAVIKYSARAGRVVSDYCCGSERFRRFENLGRNLEGKYLGGKLEN